MRKLGEKILNILCVPKMRYRLSLIVGNLSYASFLSLPSPYYLQNSIVVKPNIAMNQFHAAKESIVKNKIRSRRLRKVIVFLCYLNK